MSTIWKECTCVFICAGAPMNSLECEVHTKSSYACGGDRPGDVCDCPNYKPRSAPIPKPGGGFHWARCVCGHIAQAHN